MAKKSKMEIKYEEYLKSTDQVIVIDNIKYYKIISKDCVLNTVLIVVPCDFFINSKVISIIDENGKTFKLGLPVFYSFGGSIPQWYLKTVSVKVEGIHNINEIGEYFTISDEIE